MKWTVGPLPAAVYWRRRALVLGGLLVVILLIANTCGGSNASQAAGGGPGTAAPTSGPPSAGVPATSPTATASAPATPGPPPSSGSPSPSLSATCADSEIKVAVRIESTSATTSRLQHGGTFSITMQVSNVSQRTCVRDVGTVAEEITIKHGSATVWSSGDCSPTPGVAHDLRTFGPGDVIAAHVRWNSYRIAPHPCSDSKNPAPIGTYQLIGRVGSDVSPAVAFTIVP